jgi:transposase
LIDEDFSSEFKRSCVCQHILSVSFQTPLARNELIEVPFKISRNTINLWLHKREETGDYKASDGYQKGYGAKITDLEKFKEFARKHRSQTQREMAEAWSEAISDLTIGKALKKMGFTRKKNLTAIGRGMSAKG